MMIVLRFLLLSLSLLLLVPSLTAETSLPQSIGSYRLEQLQIGEDARQEIDRLHGKQLNFRKGYVGTYSGGGRRAKVWVSEYNSKMEAAEANDRMAQKIKEMEGRAFWHFREISISGTPVNFVIGQGQFHYFFQKGIKVIWAAVDPPEARDTIRDLIEQIP